MASPGSRANSCRQLAGALRKHLSAGSEADVRQVLRSALLPTLDYTSARTLLGVFRKLGPDGPEPVVRIAVMGSLSTGPLTDLLELYTYSRGLRAETYEADYGVFRQEILDPGSALYGFNPDFVFLATGLPDLGHLPQLGCDEDQVHKLVDLEVAEWRALWDVLQSRLTCQILQNNFVQEPHRLLGNHESAMPSSPGSFAALVNEAFRRERRPGVTIHDVDHLASCAGRWAWCDPRFFHHAKMPCAPEQLVGYADSVAAQIAAQRGLSRKCLVLDLDDTLWGGVIGDDGLEGIRIGQGDGASEAFAAFQRYVKGLGERGLILAVCSANEEATARAVFEQHPGMVLKLEDISCFVANWEDKATNLRRIASQLSIGLDSLVFVDDNPAQRALVRSLAPEVAVPEMPIDPSEYIRALEDHRYFECVSIGVEDLQRTAQYQANNARADAQQQAGGVDGYLKALRMRARIEPIQPLTLARSAQLINKTNQFNLTTRRYSLAEVETIVESPEWLSLTVSLEDRFGDSGLISVMLARREGSALNIEAWLMSCRALRRGVEQLLMNHLCEVAQRLGVDTLRGEYIPSPKNGLVADHYADLGFLQVAGNEGETTRWELAIPTPHAPFGTHIEKKASNELTPARRPGTLPVGLRRRADPDHQDDLGGGRRGVGFVDAHQPHRRR